MTWDRGKEVNDRHVHHIAVQDKRIRADPEENANSAVTHKLKVFSKCQLPVPFWKSMPMRLK